MSDPKTHEFEIKIAFLERQVEALDEVVQSTSGDLVALQRVVQRLQAKLEGTAEGDE